MTQKEAFISNTPDEPTATPVVQHDSAHAGTAPELPHDVAKQYNLHKEGLHQPPVVDTAADKDVSKEIPSAGPALSATDIADSTVEDPETEAAVDDIINKESDELLGIADKQAAGRPEVHRGFGAKLKSFFKTWWRNKTARYITIGVMVAAIATVATIPSTRYSVLNFAGVRSSASVVVLDDTTQLPLKNVTVSLNNQTAQTNKEGVATIRGLRLGKYHLQVKRIAFAKYDQNITIGWGSNPLGQVQLKAVGTQYQINVTDYLSGKAIAGAEAESDQVNALSDKNGKITLTVEDTNITKLTVKMNAPGYRPETIDLDASSEAVTPMVLVPSQKTVFASKASGKYDIYSSYLDGKDKKILLAGTGLENNTISLVVSPDGSQAAVVSTRDNLRDEDGYLLYALTFINIDEGIAVTVDHAQQLQLVDWVNNRLVYRSTIAGASGSNPQRNRLVSYDFAASSRAQLATANQFNTILGADGYIYYAVSSTDPGAALGLFRVKPDGTGRERLSDREIWTGLRTDLTTLSLQTPDGWVSYDLASKKMQKTQAPSLFTSTVFVANNKNDHIAWTDTRDGKGALILKDKSNDKTTVLTAQSGLAYPIRWLGERTIVYRVVTAAESADYAVSLDGGAPRKISDVSATYGYIQAY